MRASARTEIEQIGHSAYCRICGHEEQGESDMDALTKLGTHFQEHHANEVSSATGNVIPLKKKD